MRMLAADIAWGMVLVLLETAAFAAFWFVESFKDWAAQGRPVPGAERRLLLVLWTGSTALAAAGFTAFRVGLLVTAVTQVLLAGFLLLGAGTESCRLIGRARSRRRRRRAASR
ncbi:DUF6234 family protein [Streptomyces sp. NPDC006691]|uniref:DUF6234 family protein n=1 Tax=Streptomyces sp. NPDC006691 TaxID=3364757 RepID=UPI0036AC0707